MLAKSRRILKKQFLEIHKKGKVFRFGCLTLWALKAPAQKSRFAFSVSKKTAPKSTERNLLKRRMRAALHKHLKETGQGWLAVFYLKKNGKQRGFREIEEEMVFLLKKAGLVLKR